MPLPPLSPARVFAELVPPPVSSGNREDDPPGVAEGGRSEGLLPPVREVHVSGSAELSARPDRAKVNVFLRSRKGEAGAARNSVIRRLDYVAQTARQRGGISITQQLHDLRKDTAVLRSYRQENDVTVTKNFSRTDNAYKMEAEKISDSISGHILLMGDANGVINLELDRHSKNLWKRLHDAEKASDNLNWNLLAVLDARNISQNWMLEMSGLRRIIFIRGGLVEARKVCITFSDFGKMQDTCNLLVEKLDSSVTISPPHFYHTMEAVDSLRRQVCVAAVGSARQKAQEVCQLFGHSLGKPLLIREEEVREWEGHPEDHAASSSNSLSLQQKLHSATICVSSRVFAIFEIKGEKKRKKAALIKVH